MLPSVVMEMYHPKGKRKKKKIFVFCICFNLFDVLAMESTIHALSYNTGIYFFRVIFFFYCIFTQQ